MRNDELWAEIFRVLGQNATCKMSLQNLNFSWNFCYFVLQIVKPGPPQKPTNLEVTAVDDTSVSLAWNPGFNGGYNQSFDIQVFDERSGQRVLKLKNIRRVEGNRTVILGLTPQTRYALKIRAWNRDGYSNFSEEVIIKTRRE